MSIDDWIEAIEAVAPGAVAPISHESSPLPFPSDIEHEALRALGEVPVMPYREAIAATARIYQRLKDEGRLNPADQGVATAGAAGLPTAVASATTVAATSGASSSARSSA